MKLIETIKEKAEKATCAVVEFYNNHEKQIKTGAIVIGSVAFGYVMCKLTGKSDIGKLDWKDSDGTKEKKKYLPEENAVRAIDEDIFTDLACKIEDAVLEEGVDECHFDRTYTVPFPKGGDYRDGSYNVLKNVQVLVRDAGDGEDGEEGKADSGICVKTF